MIKIENVEIVGLAHAIRGMRNPMNSWENSDSNFCAYSEHAPRCGECLYSQSCCAEEADLYTKYIIGSSDHELMLKLASGGPVHAKYRRMITVYLDITAPLYWWKEFDTYKVGTVANSCSTMHKIHAKEFTLEDFSYEHLRDFDGHKDPVTGSPAISWFKLCLEGIIDQLNYARKLYLETKDKTYWWQMIQLLPSSYNQRRTVMLNYEVLAGIHPMRKNQKLDEWREFCRWIENLPYSEVITGGEKE